MATRLTKNTVAEERGTRVSKDESAPLRGYSG
ncbi:hypothetical protein ACVIHD_004391 [Bradyrhizobium embrapense]